MLQVESLRGTVRYLRSENAYLKGQDLLKEVQQLPALPNFIPLTPPRSPTRSLSIDAEESVAEQPPSLRSLAMETKHLYRDVITFSATPKVIDLSAMNKSRSEGRPWISQKHSPASQVLERKKAADALNRKVKALLERAGTVGVLA